MPENVNKVYPCIDNHRLAREITKKIIKTLHLDVEQIKDEILISILRPIKEVDQFCIIKTYNKFN